MATVKWSQVLPETSGASWKITKSFDLSLLSAFLTLEENFKVQIEHASEVQRDFFWACENVGSV
jgi:hypothetical protein